MSDNTELRAALRAMIGPLATMAENEQPAGVEAAWGHEWAAQWRERAQKALAEARRALSA